MGQFPVFPKVPVPPDSRRLLALIALIGGVLAPMVSGASDALLRDAQDAYFDADFDLARTKLTSCLADETMPREHRVRCLELMAAVHLAARNTSAAAEQIHAILDLDPAYRMNPERVPPGMIQLYYTALQDRDMLMTREGVETVAVLDLRNHAVGNAEDYALLGQGIADILIAAIAGATDMQVVERERLDFIIEELERSAEPGVVDPETATEAGRLLGAQTIVVGGFTVIDKKIRLTGRVVETETSRILRTQSVTGKVDEIFELIDSLGELVASDLGQEYKKGELRIKADYESLFAYSRGLDAYDRGDLVSAVNHFERALSVSPDFAKARNRLEQLTPLSAGSFGADEF